MPDYFSAGTRPTPLARWVAVLALNGMLVVGAQADEQLLVFKPANKNTVSPAPAKQRNEALASPTAHTGAARRTPTRTPPQASSSVSAVEYMHLPARLAERSQQRHTVMGPSERELRQILRQAVDIAIARSPALLRAKGEQQAAVSDVDEVKGQRWPQLQVGSQTQAAQFGNGSRNEQGSGGINVGVTTMLYDWGRVGNTIESREKLTVAADKNVQAETELIGFEVVQTLVELGKQRMIGELSQSFANRMKELVDMLAGIVAVDTGRASELTQAKARLLQAQALRDAADAKARDAEITLLKLVGNSPVPIPSQKEWNIRLANLDQLIAVAQDHPTLLQAVAQAESALLQADAVRASGLPQLNWNVSKNTAEDALGQEQAWQTNLSISWNAFSGGSTRAAERAALQRAEASRYETDQKRRDLEFKIRTSDNDARTQLERAELYRNLSVESDRIREAFYLQWHHLGKRTLLDVLTAENDHYGNQVSEITNRFDGYQSILRQYTSAGALMQWLRDER